MNWKALLNVIISAAIGGALDAFVQSADSGVKGKSLGVAVGTGAAISVIQHLREKPELVSPKDGE